MSLYQIIPQGHSYCLDLSNLHRGQCEAWHSKARFNWIIAGHQSGKTSFGPLWLWNEIQRCGPGDYLAVTATYDLFKLKMLPEMLALFVEGLHWGKYHAGDKLIVSHDGKTRIILRSAASPGGLESNTALAAWLDECGQDEFPLSAWEAIQRRLSLATKDGFGRVLGTTTPYNLGWLWSQVFKRWKGGDPDHHVIQFKSTMNPLFPMAEYRRAKKTLPLWKFLMFYDGVFTRPAGMIYADFIDDYRERGGHLVKPFRIPDDWKRYTGHDFGGTEHTAVLWIAEEPGTGVYYAFREKLGGGLTGPEHAKNIIDYREPIALSLGGTSSEDEARMQYRRAGLGVIEPRIHEVEPGIDHGISLFKQRRLFIFDTLSELRAELGTYRRELDDDGEPTLKIDDKAKYHILDALRYVLSAFPEDAPKPPDPTEDLPPRARELGEDKKQQKWGYAIDDAA